MEKRFISVESAERLKESGLEFSSDNSQVLRQDALDQLDHAGVHVCVDYHISAEKYYVRVCGHAHANYTVGFFANRDEGEIAAITLIVEKGLV